MAGIDVKSDEKNQLKTLSLSGLNTLRRHEGVKDYYNDIAGNCTKGIGVLVHKGNCTESELKLAVSDVERAKSFESAINTAVRAVRQRTKNQELSQTQFDALVSFTYNVGPSGARLVLMDVNAGNINAAAARMLRYNKYTPVDQKGKPLKDKSGKDISKVSAGLTRRRIAESRALVEGSLPPQVSGSQK